MNSGEDSQKERRKRLKALSLAQTQMTDTTAQQTKSKAHLPNPLVDPLPPMNTNPNTGYPEATPPPFPPPPHHHHPGMQSYQIYNRGRMSSSHNRQGRMGGDRGRNSLHYQDGGRFNNQHNRNSRGGYRGMPNNRSHSSQHSRIEPFFSRRMLENPWDRFEKKTCTVVPEGEEQGKFSGEGISDRPWH